MQTKDKINDSQERQSELIGFTIDVFVAQIEDSQITNQTSKYSRKNSNLLQYPVSIFSSLLTTTITTNQLTLSLIPELENKDQGCRKVFRFDNWISGILILDKLAHS